MIPLAEYRSYLNFPSAKEVELLALKDEVESLWSEITQRPWKSEEDRIDIFRIDGTRVCNIFPFLTPITGITKVEERTASATEWTELTDGWEQIDNSIMRIGAWWASLVRVTYDGGYATGACPAAIKRALKLQAKFTRERLDTEVKITSQSFQGGAGSFARPFVHEHFASLAEMYRRLV